MKHDYNELLEEIAQQHTKDRLLNFWNNFGNWILAVAGAILVGAGGYNIYQSPQVDASTRKRLHAMIRLITLTPSQ